MFASYLTNSSRVRNLFLLPNFASSKIRHSSPQLLTSFVSFQLFSCDIFFHEYCAHKPSYYQIPLAYKMNNLKNMPIIYFNYLATYKKNRKSDIDIKREFFKPLFTTFGSISMSKDFAINLESLIFYSKKKVSATIAWCAGEAVKASSISDP